MLFCLWSAFAAAGEKMSIGFSNFTLDGVYFKMLSEAVQKAGEDAGYDVILTNAENNTSKQIADCEDMLVQGISFLLLNPIDPVSGLQIAKKAATYNVPVITIDMGIGPAANVLTRISSNNVDGNKLLGAYCADLMKDEPVRMALVSFAPGVLVSEERSGSFIQGLVEQQLKTRGSASLNIVMQTFGQGSDEGGLKCVEDILTAHPETNVIFTVTSLHLKGMVNAIRAAKRADIKLFSFDGAKFEYDAIKKDQLAATAENSPNKLAGLAMDVIKKHRDGERDFAYRMTPNALVVNKDNVDKVYNDGF
jgi:ribose transport system substrate-binding protein